MKRVFVLTLLAFACRAPADDAPGQAVADSSANATPPVDTVPSLPPGVLPPIGIAVADSAGGWCAEFVSTAAPDSALASHAASIVFGKPDGTVSLRVRVRGRHEGECPAAFPQPRWADYVSFRVDLVDSFPPSNNPAPIVGLIVLGNAQWSMGPTGHARADVDRDNAPDELRRCAADEGEHFSLWALDGAGARTRRWHEYFDWGGIVDPTCGPGEDGR